MSYESMEAEERWSPEAAVEILDELETQLDLTLDTVAECGEAALELVDDKEDLHFDPEMYRSSSRAVNELQGLRQRIIAEHSLNQGGEA